MLHILIGTDSKKISARVSALRGNRTLERLSLNAENAPSQLSDYAGAATLFGETPAILLEGLDEEGEAKEVLRAFSKALSDSENIFIAPTSSLDVASRKQMKGAEIEVLTETKLRKREPFNIFSLADAFGARDRKLAWVQFARAKRAGLENENIHGTLHWITRAMQLASRSPSASASGLSPFVFSKVARFAKSWSTSELDEALLNLTELYHRARRGMVDLEVGLEAFLLNDARTGEKN